MLVTKTKSVYVPGIELKVTVAVALPKVFVAIGVYVDGILDHPI
jgi:hypothetical protein